MNTYIISRIIERIGDHAVRCVENVKRIETPELPDDLLDAIRAASTLSLAIFDNSIVSFFKSDIRGAHRNIEQVRKLEELCEDINVLAMRRNRPQLSHSATLQRVSGVQGNIQGIFQKMSSIIWSSKNPDYSPPFYIVSPDDSDSARDYRYFIKNKVFIG